MFAASPSAHRSLSVAKAALVAALLSASPMLAQAATSGPTSFPAGPLTLRNVVGEVVVTVDPSARDLTVTIDADDPAEFALLSARADGGGVLVSRSKPLRDGMRDRKEIQTEDVTIHITLPTGTAVNVDDMIGELEIGDLRGPLTADIRAAAQIKAGHLTAARFNVKGAADIETGDIDGALRLDVAGAGNVQAGSVGDGVDINLNGAGNVDLAAVRGNAKIRVSGVGAVDIAKGDVDLLDVSVSGFASVDYQGKVRERRVNSSGMASVTVNGDRL